MKLFDVLPKEEWAEFEQELHERFGVNACVFDGQGMRITGYANWANELCPKIKADKGSLQAICAVGNQEFMRQAKEKGETIVGECDAGFVKVCAPIVVQSQFLGIAGGCGLLEKGQEVDEFLICKTSSLKEDEVAELAKTVSVVTREEIADMAAWIEEHLREISETGLL